VIDRPRAAERVGRVVTVSGWAISASAVESVEVYVDGHLRATTRPGLPRPDVLAAFPHWASSRGSSNDRPGWTATVELGSEPGPYSIRARAIDDQGGTETIGTVVVSLISRP
jgi:hypothetical protein